MAGEGLAALTDRPRNLGPTTETFYYSRRPANLQSGIQNPRGSLNVTFKGLPMRPTAQSNRSTSQFSSPCASPRLEALQSHLGEVLECHGAQHRVQTALGPLTASLATHVPGVEPGQQVVLQCTQDPSSRAALIVAAYPLHTGPHAPTLDYDPASSTLKITATRLELTGLDTVALRCGDASVRLDIHGELSCQADRILSAALGSHRIEGASVEIN